MCVINFRIIIIIIIIIALQYDVLIFSTAMEKYIFYVDGSP